MQITFMKKAQPCSKCGHSRAAHIDGTRCALCGCAPLRDEVVQELLPFRSLIPLRVTVNTRKR